MMVGLIGLGLVGSALVKRFTCADLEVIGFDIDETKVKESVNNGMVAAGSPQHVAEQVDRVMLSLPNSSVVDQVVKGDGGVAAATEPPEIIIDTTTADPVMSVTLGDWLQEREIGFLDATILGSSKQVEDGDVLLMVGGDSAVVSTCDDIFSTFARRVFHMGEQGKGAEAKLVVNLVLGLNRLVLAEGLVLGQKAGMDASALLDVLVEGAAYSRVMDAKGPKMIDGDFTPQARLVQHLKDVELILELGARTDTPLPVSALHAQILRSGVAQGFGGDDNSAVIRALRRMAGLEEN